MGNLNVCEAALSPQQRCVCCDEGFGRDGGRCGGEARRGGRGVVVKQSVGLGLCSRWVLGKLRVWISADVVPQP
jgi:hypothetical protein